MGRLVHEEDRLVDFRKYKQSFMYAVEQLGILQNRKAHLVLQLGDVQDEDGEQDVDNEEGQNVEAISEQGLNGQRNLIDKGRDHEFENARDHVHEDYLSQVIRVQHDKGQVIRNVDHPLVDTVVKNMWNHG